jgi:hypothetical protein
MPSEEGYKYRIQTYGWTELETLWQNIQEGNTPDWASGKALEYFILRAFELEKAEVRYPYFVSNVEQIDGVIYIENIACIIECKDTTDLLNFEPIAKLRSQLMHRPVATIGSIFSISGITQPALKLLDTIQPQTILIWEKVEIDYCLKNKKFCASLIKKYRTEIEFGGYYRCNVSIDTSREDE